MTRSMTKREKRIVMERADYWEVLGAGYVGRNGHTYLCPAGVLSQLRGAEAEKTWDNPTHVPNLAKNYIHLRDLADSLDDIVAWLGFEDIGGYLDRLPRERRNIFKRASP